MRAASWPRSPSARRPCRSAQPFCALPRPPSRRHGPMPSAAPDPRTRRLRRLFRTAQAVIADRLRRRHRTRRHDRAPSLSSAALGDGSDAGAWRKGQRPDAYPGMGRTERTAGTQRVNRRDRALRLVGSASGAVATILKCHPARNAGMSPLAPRERSRAGRADRYRTLLCSLPSPPAERGSPSLQSLRRTRKCTRWTCRRLGCLGSTATRERCLTVVP